MKATSNRRKSALDWRSGSGRFARAPSMEKAGLAKVCECGAFILKAFPADDGPRPGPVAARGTWPSACETCEKVVS